MKGHRLADLFKCGHALLSFIYILTPPTFASAMKTDEADSVSYGVLLDAGSSSTKLKVYRWDSSASTSLVPRIELLVNKRYDPGLSVYEHNETGLNLYMQNIVAEAKETVPTNKYSDTPIFLMATAGLRFLSAADATVFLGKTKAVLANKNVNPFVYKPAGVNILSGEVEGVYSWIAANYLTGFFDDYKPNNASVGILEMGGGSTQIAFIPNGPIFSEEYLVEVAGRSYQLYVQSYLQFGSNAIKLQVAHELSDPYPNATHIDNPCMLRGDVRNTTLEDGRLLTERGAGSPTTCVELLREILKPHTGMGCQPKPCAIGGVHQPSVADLKFLAIQAFTYTPKSLKAVGDDKTLDIERIEAAAYRHCVKFVSANASSDDCLMGLYIPTLLTVSYGFSRNTTNIKLTLDIRNETIDWALGAMLVELSSSFNSQSFSVTCKSDSKSSVTVDPASSSTSSPSLLSCAALIIVLPIWLLFISSNNLGLNLFH